MRHGRLTREQAIGIMGKDLVDRLDRENCVPTGRLQTDGDDSTEYVAYLRGIALDDGQERTLQAYYSFFLRGVRFALRQTTLDVFRGMRYI